MVHFGHSGCSLESCAYGVCSLCWSFTPCLQDSGYGGVPIAGHVLWAEVCGGILCVTLGSFLVCSKMCSFFQGGGSDPICMVPYMLALAGQPSLHGYYACVVFWAKGEFWRNCRQILRKTSFSRFLFFSV